MLKRKLPFLLGVMLITGLIFGCMRGCGGGHQKLSPEEVVQAYLDIAFNMQSIEQREELLQYTTGSLKEALSAASDDAIKEAYIDPRYVLERYSVLERRDRTPRETEITFQVVYKNMQKETPEDNLKPDEIPTVTVENTVAVVKEKQLWMIKEVLNKRSSFFFPVAPENMHIKAEAPK